METTQITLFGRLAIRRGASSVELPAKAAELLCYLLLHRNRPQTREALATELWGDRDTAQGKKYLRKTLWQLQQLLDDSDGSMLNLDQHWVALNPAAPLQMDVQNLELAGVAMAACPPERLEAPLVDRALAAADGYQADLLTGWYQDWCLIERERYQSLYFALTDAVMDHFARVGRLDEGTALGLRVLRFDPTRERTHRRLMRLAALAGDRGAALRQFTRCTEALERIFGIAPAAATLALAEQIRSGAYDGDTPEAAPAGLATLTSELARAQAQIVDLQRDLAALKHALGSQ